MICPRKKRPVKDEDFSAIAVPSMKGHGYLDYTIESYPSRALQLMDELRQHGLLCDMVLRVTYKETIVDFKVRVFRGESTRKMRVSMIRDRPESAPFSLG